MTAYPAREVSAASENPSNPKMPARTTTSHTALTGVCVCLFIFFHHRDPGSALSRANAKTTREASTTWAAPVTYCVDDMSQTTRYIPLTDKRTWTTMIKDHMASMPFFPSTVRNSWPIGNGRSVPKISGTDAVAKEAAMNNSHPKDAVPKTLTRIAIGAARAAPAVSSAMWAAESSGGERVKIAQDGYQKCGLQPVSVHIGAVKASMNAHPPKHVSEWVLKRRKNMSVLLLQPLLFS